MIIESLDNNLYTVYNLLDRNLNPYYIGITNNFKRRKKEHITNCTSNRIERNHPIKELPKYRKARKVGKIIMQQLISDISFFDADLFEKSYIQHFKDEEFKIYNLTDGGIGRIGYITSDKTKQKISKSKIGKSWGIHTEITKQKISMSHKGKKFTNEHKNKLKVARNKRIITEKTKKKMSKSSKGKINIKKYILISPDGKEHITNEGLTKFCEEHNISCPNMHKVLNGERKHHKRWTIRRYNNDN